MKYSARIALLVGILIACIGCDQATKAIAQNHLGDRTAITFLNDSVRVQLAYNDGAFLSLGASLSPAWRHALLSVGVGLVLAGLLGYLLTAKQIAAPRLWALALILGGGLGNLIDRIVHGGYVVDFLNFGIGPLRTGIFNVADVLLCIGVVVLLFEEKIEKRLAE